MSEKVGYPLGILDVGLATRHRLDMMGVDHPDGELVLHQVDDRLPVDPRALHGDVGDSALPKPVRQLQKPSGGCAKRPRLLGLRGHHAGHHRLLVYIQSTASIMYDSHTPPPKTSCRPVGGCSSEDFAIRAHRSSGATFLHACQPPRQIPRRARGTNDRRPSCTARRSAIFISLMWPCKGHSDSERSAAESKNLKNPRNEPQLHYHICDNSIR